ncbi:hypothetical protein FHX82_004044 [Amycolatopsis bartoniae]|uniref:PASTA domain-containing protein n=1 Tax=Amycolatopsis bartoniae TaxID=941986 RepID=A0A8H9M4W2_9PSEU|nr:PASTA domain-containing protein [Amycolatopsis bartoniae]MBB2936980.1 hypothetical protein [Amycolatopsis bartoniae]TVT06437.1 hypothetical protein FNH07_20145 [Amycolatopsis bartoniae]GHF51600.1 PASTA domain-containing protein [Amycolatopsis bartoniae]
MHRTIGLSLGVLVSAVAVAGCGPADGRDPGVTTPATSGAAPRLITVPDVGGMNHQDAQDTMQAAGLYNLREVDGTGRGRMLILDRDWVQTGQSPAAGSQVPPDTVVTLTAVKYSDR